MTIDVVLISLQHTYVESSKRGMVSKSNMMMFILEGLSRLNVLTEFYK